MKWRSSDDSSGMVALQCVHDVAMLASIGHLVMTEKILENMPYAAVCPWCGENWLYLLRMPKEKEPINVNDILRCDGTQPAANALKVCKHCNNQIATIPLSSIRKIL